MVRLTPAEQEYLHQFHGINKAAAAAINLAPIEQLASSSNSAILDGIIKQEQETGDDVELIEENASSASQTGSMLLAAEDSFRGGLKCKTI